MILDFLRQLIQFINDKIDLSSVDTLISNFSSAWNTIDDYVAGAFYFLPHTVTMLCLGVVVAVLVVRVVMAIVNIIYP